MVNKPENMVKIHPMSNYKIFISYSRRDRWIAEQMVRNIEQRCGDRADVFRDERGIRGGESIPEAIRQHIIECDEFMILLTQHSVEREWVKIELGAAWGQSKLIVAVTHYVSPEEMPTINSAE